MNNKIFFVVAGILLFACVVGLMAYLPVRFDTTAQIKIADLPKTIGDWQATDIPLTKLDYEILETTNLVMRQYKDPAGTSIYLYIVYSNDNRKVVHPPEVCYMGSGATVAEKGALQISPRIRANKMVTESAGGRQLVAYWYKAGQFYTDNYFQNQLKIVWRRTFGKSTSAALIRVSLDIKGGDEAAAVELIRKFCGQLEPLLAKYAP